jgi:hypothetical protein
MAAPAQLRPGDRVTCTHCGAQVVAAFTSGSWQEGYPVSLVWTHGPHQRWEVTHTAPARCSWCHALGQALGPDAPPLYRPLPARDAGGDLSTASALPAPPPAALDPGREVPSSAPSDVLRWCADDAGDVPAWVVTLTGLKSREEIVEKWGTGARFAEPASGTAEAAPVRPTAPYAPPVTCPRCSAPPGKPCLSGTGRERPPHVHRLDADLAACELEEKRRATRPAAKQLGLFGGAR